MWRTCENPYEKKKNFIKKTLPYKRENMGLVWFKRKWKNDQFINKQTNLIKG